MTTLKTIKISEENYKWLVGYAGKIQEELKEPVSLDRALTLLRPKKISSYAGIWKEFDDKKLKKVLKRGWKWEIPSF
ncbi:hypothetical protein HY489_06170 [Candidatus Woesearchaeota archaeon]|nr:hypothetical protein [Candidatus Woesearchaeota archaeon]